MSSTSGRGRCSDTDLTHLLEDRRSVAVSFIYSYLESMLLTRASKIVYRLHRSLADVTARWWVVRLVPTTDITPKFIPSSPN